MCVLKDKTLKKNMVLIGFNNIIECRIMTKDIVNDKDENLLLALLGDETKLNIESLSTRNEMFNFLEKRFGWSFNYWMEIRPNTNNEIKRIHILRLSRQQFQWEFNGMLLFRAGKYDIFKYPQFGFDVQIYD
jgi:hypothetical protein